MRLKLRLCLALGIPSLRELEARLSSRELLLWAAYLETHENPELRADQRAGMLATILYNMNRPKGTVAHTPEDFFPSLKVAKKSAGPQGADEQKRIVQQALLNAQRTLSSI